MERRDEEESRGFDLVLKELMGLHENQSKDSKNRSGFDRVLRELMAEREKVVVATALLKKQDEMALMLAKQQNDFQLQLQKQQEEFQAKIDQEKCVYQAKLEQEKRDYQVHLEKHQDCLEHERREHKLMQDQLLARQDELISSQDHERKEERRRQEEEKKEERRRQEEEKKEERRHQEEEKKEERRRQDQERRDALQQQERQQAFFREVIQQLQDEVKVLRHNESAHLISGTQGEVETPGKQRTTASSSPYSMTPLSLMMETPNKPFEDSIGGGEVGENFAAGDSGSVDETNNCVENDAVEEEEPTKITKSDQGSVILSDEDLRAKGLISSEETFLLNKSDQVGNKVENAKGNKLPLQKMASSKSRTLRDAKEKMKMIAGKQKLIVVLICEETSNMDQKEVTSFRTIASRLG